jgi:hypothetical protein
MCLHQILDCFRPEIGCRKIKPLVGWRREESQNKSGLLADQVIL